jgi:hypothetical protein
MSQSYHISRLNKDLEHFHAIYSHDSSKSLSKRDASIKSAAIKFLNEQNFIYDPSKASFIREKVFTLSPQELDVILGVWNMLRSSKKIPKNTPQRFEIAGLCSITIIKAKGKMLCIHQKSSGSKACEKRGLAQKVALGIERKQVRFFKETHHLDVPVVPHKSQSIADKVSYLCRPTNHKANFAISCVLEKKWQPIDVQDLLQWRSRFGVLKHGLSEKSELFIVASVANYLGFLTLFESSQSGFKMSDIKLAFPQQALMQYGSQASLRHQMPGDLLDKIETVMISSDEDLGIAPSMICKDLASLHHLLDSLITHSPHHFSKDVSTKTQVKDFLAWILNLKETFAQLDIVETKSLELKTVKLLYDHLSVIEHWSDDLEGFVVSFFGKLENLLEANHPLSELMQNLTI